MKRFVSLVFLFLLGFSSVGYTELQSNRPISSAPLVTLNIDIDGNQKLHALTDGLLILRSMFGFTGSSLTEGAVANDAVYRNPEDIQVRISGLGNRLDIDNNGNVDALTDGLIILRYLFGLRGDVLIERVIASDANRVTVADVEAHLETITRLDVELPVFTSSPNFVASENQLSIGTVTGTDVDSDPSLISFTVSGSELLITSDGILSFAFVPDYETKSVYTATVTASDGTNSATQTITVAIIDVDESVLELDYSCDSAIERKIPQEGSCEGLLITQDQYVESKSDGIESIGFGDGTGLRLSEGQFIDLADESCLQLGKMGQDFALSFWFKTTIDPDSQLRGGEPQIIGTKSQYNNKQGFIIVARTIWTGGLHIQAGSADSAGSKMSVRSEPIKQGEWTHVVVNYLNSGTESSFTIYTDTVKVQGEAAPNVYNTSLRIGDEGWGQMPTFDVAEFRSFDRLLTDKEVSQLFFHGSSNAGREPSSLLELIQRLYTHIDNQNPMTVEELRANLGQLDKLIPLIASDSSLIRAAMGLVDHYEKHMGPLFINPATRGGFSRAEDDDLELSLARLLMKIQQGILDYQFSGFTLPACQHILSNRDWKTAENFPGSTDRPSAATETYSATINAHNPAYWGRRVAFAKDPSRQPTGYYLSAGSIGEVVVPPELVGRGYSILVGAHTADHQRKNNPKRMDRVSTRFEITQQTTKIGNPLGGGIYIEVPYLETLGPKEIQLRGVIKSPLYSLRSFDKTTADEWLSQRSHPGPWADFVSDKFMMQVPTSWIYDFDQPEELMTKWDLAMDGVSEFMGILPEDRNKVVAYLQPDLRIRHGAFGIGYPQVNELYDPEREETGNSTHWFLTNPSQSYVEYHEMGHAQLISMFSGETEAIVNFPHVYVRNVKFDVDFEIAFAESRHYKYFTVDEAAINWMITVNFANGQPMDKSNTPDDQFRYQQRGYAKYADIVRLYGWDAYTNFNRQEHLDFINNVSPNDLSDTDSRILRLSISAGFDLTPLIHFWGIHPSDPSELAEAMRVNDLARDIQIKELLQRYHGLIPVDNQMFNDHFERVHPGRPSGGDPRYGLGWYNAWRDVWDEPHGSQAQMALDSLIDQYYESPIFTTSPVFDVTRGSGTYIGQVAANDPQGDTISYSLEGRDASLITVGSSSGVLTFSADETQSSYEAIVIATDGVNSTEQNIIVSVID
ncbi:M60 family metallopeptidase [Porticoccaceae bacterium]|nr:M60 family metallopeptidase [Porticoccaceae bacterium]MDA8651302.1 M60 family metallopeptidase [Porticoccaceae bacterium]MDA8682549.1 M60 family metallopeptidase [Porticoccaceae bacterium]MDA8788903.1 M60 family metallopeptidase [Porticoccaceae bacterium]MDB2635139.1 M60 family metallopeptidase [Porticoccaceae bacterium]